MDEVVSRATEATADIASGASLLAGGFGLRQRSSVWIAAFADSRVSELGITSNNWDVPTNRRGLFLLARRSTTTTPCQAGRSNEFEQQYLHGELDVELVPEDREQSDCVPPEVRHRFCAGLGLGWQGPADDFHIDGDGRRAPGTEGHQDLSISNA
jgi:hypothetical protein